MPTHGTTPGDRPHLAMVVANPLRVGGMQTFTRFLVDAVLAADWRVTIALSGHDIYDPSGTGDLAVERVDWVDEHLAGDRRYRGHVIRNRHAWFRRVRPDVALFVQSSNTPFRAAIVGARWARVPVVITHRTMPWIKDFVPIGRHLFGLLPGLGLHNRRQILKTRITAALADRIVFNSHAVQHDYEKIYRYPRRKCVVIPNAIEIPPPPPPHARESSPVVLGYVGRLADEKRLDILLRAVAAMTTRRAVQVLVYGDGPEQSKLARLAYQLGIGDRVAWTGTTNNIWSAYNRMDVVALCSRRESSSNMVLEAMASGKAVVAADVGGNAELLGHGRYGRCVPRENVSALASALQELVEDSPARHHLGESARQAAAINHRPCDIRQQWIALLTQVAEHKQRLFPKIDEATWTEATHCATG